MATSNLFSQFTLADTLTKLRADLEKRYGDRLAKVILFGSQARGEAESTSDVDILVVLKGKVDPVAEINANSNWLSDFCLETEQLVNCLYLSDTDFAHEDTALLKNIRREGILL
ncbi:MULTISPECIES: nucleotidyltransferase domain-containing protein [unclassified Synechocystis]|uniref:nucleotidyltransferase domain-containing protein n=1 Tax=unclassified Synechocystis TaxID=2640012 RepID=UPI00041CC1A5|nr:MULTISPECIES: nucleotidyltransferase domain-containing protein [unclassified Synechocystis]AIE73994.1 hypothetical protein D082_14660 [Synechocystis sp. PCC 6714]MCT0252555.1 nucleotidyltransferase domain-containing protein [Synechocystis sp. CS-94]